MKKIYLLLTGLLLTQSVLANEFPEALLNKISLQLHTEQWITTNSALLSVTVNAAVADQGIEKVQNDVLQKLNQLSSKGEWHVTSYDRELDKSGLESLRISAQARIPQTDLPGLRDKAKNISKPGNTFTIDNVQFTPSEDEQRLGQIAMRNNIYQQAKMELDTINKFYSEQKYYIHEINFLNGLSPQPVPVMRNEMYMKAGAAAVPAATPLDVGNKQELTAYVVLATAPPSTANGSNATKLSLR